MLMPNIYIYAILTPKGRELEGSWEIVSHNEDAYFSVRVRINLNLKRTKLTSKPVY